VSQTIRHPFIIRPMPRGRDSPRAEAVAIRPR
jgi:hypothetical protein